MHQLAGNCWRIIFKRTIFWFSVIILKSNVGTYAAWNCASSFANALKIALVLQQLLFLYFIYLLVIRLIYWFLNHQSYETKGLRPLRHHSNISANKRHNKTRNNFPASDLIKCLNLKHVSWNLITDWYINPRTDGGRIPGPPEVYKFR